MVQIRTLRPCSVHHGLFGITGTKSFMRQYLGLPFKFRSLRNGYPRTIKASTPSAHRRLSQTNQDGQLAYLATVR